MTETAHGGGAGNGSGRDRIEHVIVLMMENRSFDHLLGYLNHPSPDYPNLDRLDPPASCPVDPARPDGPMVGASATAHTVLGVDPDHSPQAVRVQIFGREEWPATTAPAMAGFIRSFASKIADASPAPPNPLVAALRRLEATVRRLLGRAPRVALGADIMRCFDEAHAPVLTTLARHYAVMTHWHASVPGETWPNRNFAHAATSDGTNRIEMRFYENPTIFDQLGAGGVDWRIYHDGIAQTWAFPSLWMDNRDHFHDSAELLTDIASDNLPAYAFVEPNHGYGRGDGDSQHPANNTENGDSFAAGEALMARIYRALAAHPDVFEKTLLLITYDEHGGFFDHEPPVPVPSPDGKVADDGFDFSISGVRVPAVAISPLIPKGFVDPTGYDHASIPKTVRTRFLPDAPALTARDAAAEDLLAHLPLLDTPRTDRAPVAAPPPRPPGVPSAVPLTAFEASLLHLAGAVHTALDSAPVAAAEHRSTRVAGTTQEPAPPYRPDPALREAARQRVLVPGSPASQAVDDVLAAFRE